MALGSPYSYASVASGGSSAATMQEQLAKLYAMSQALRQQSGFGAPPMQGGMQTNMQPYQPPQGGMMPSPQLPMPQGQQQSMMGDMSSMMPMLMMMLRRQQQPGLGQTGFGNQAMRAGF